MKLKISKKKLIPILECVVAREGDLDVTEIDFDGYIRCLCCSEVKPRVPSSNICQNCQEDFSRG